MQANLFESVGDIKKSNDFIDRLFSQKNRKKKLAKNTSVK